MKKLLCLLVICLMGLPIRSNAGVWPEHPIRLIVPFPPGGGSDVLARLLSQKMEADLGVSIVVENRPGGDSQIGNYALVRSAPDGYTIGMVTSQLGINKSLYTNVPYDPVKDLTPICLLAATPFYVAVNAQSSFRTMDDLTRASTQPGANFTYGTASSLGYLNAELMRAAGGLLATHIPYRGASESITALAAGQITFAIDTILAMRPLVDAKKLRLLAVASPRRVKNFPDLPALSEIYKGFAASGWWGLAGPAALPADVVARLNRSVRTAIASPEIQARLDALGAESAYGDDARLAAQIRADLVDYAAIVKSNNLQPGR